MTHSQDHRPSDVERYPLDMIVAIVSPDALTALLADLKALGPAVAQLDVAQGPDDAQRIVDATEQGVRGWLTGVLAPGEEHVQRQRYVEALRAGSAVVRARLGGATHKDRVSQTLIQHGGAFVNYYGRWTVETLHP